MMPEHFNPQSEICNPQYSSVAGPAGAAETAQLSVGIVLPVFNEATILDSALDQLERVATNCQVVIADGGSTDGSAEIARRRFRTQICPQANRGDQMNRGARCLETDVLLFLHVDSRLPSRFDSYIQRALKDPRIVGGCFQLCFDFPHPMLRFYSWFTRFPGRFFHFGDQGIFVRREVFLRLGGYSKLTFLEDVDLLRRLQGYGRFAILPAPMLTSARRFLRHGIVRQQLLNILVVTLFEFGLPARRLARFYPIVR